MTKRQLSNAASYARLRASPERLSARQRRQRIKAAEERAAMTAWDRGCIRLKRKLHELTLSDEEHRRRLDAHNQARRNRLVDPEKRERMRVAKRKWRHRQTKSFRELVAKAGRAAGGRTMTVRAKIAVLYEFLALCTIAGGISVAAYAQYRFHVAHTYFDPLGIYLAFDVLDRCVALMGFFGFAGCFIYDGSSFSGKLP